MGPGSEVFSVGPFILVLLRSPRLLDSRSSRGGVVTARAGLLLVPPISLQDPSVPESSLVFRRGGETQVAPPISWVREDPSRWIDLSAYSSPTLSPLGEPPGPLPAALEVKFVPKQKLLHADIDAAAIDALREALDRVREELPPPRLRLVDLLRSWWARAKASLSAPKSGSGTRLGAGQVAMEPARLELPRLRPGLFARLRERLGAWVMRGRLLEGLQRALGMRQAEYIGQMLDMFERGDLSQALRHAIPIAPSRGELEPTSLGLAKPRPRDELRISRGETTMRGLAVSDALFDHLRQTYRRAYERLLREGRVEEAAYVLAELIGETYEAIDLLEKHDKLELAAELAEGRKVQPAVVVRQWLVAGEVSRAIAYARHTRAFEAALLLLERRGETDLTRSLRVAYADHLAETGELERAVETIWPLADARALADRWIELGIAQGGPEAARLLAQKLMRGSASFADVREQLRTMLSAATPDGARTRWVLARKLTNELGVAPKGPGALGAKALLSAVVRASIADRGLGRSILSRADLTRAARATGDGALAADLPALADLSSRLEGGGIAVDTFLFEKSDTGSFGVDAAVLLPNGRILVALGEAGVKMLSPRGKTIATFDVPAHALVVSAKGESAIAIAERGRLKRLSKIDLLWRKASRWDELELTAYAPTYREGRWFVATPTEVVALDVLASRAATSWRVDRLGGRVVSIRASELTMAFVMVQSEHTWPSERETWPPGESMPAPIVELWRYDLPSPTLRSRRDAAMTKSWDGRAMQLGLTPEGGLVRVGELESTILVFVERAHRSSESSESESMGIFVEWPKGEGTRLCAVATSTGRVALALLGERGVEVVAFRRSDGKPFVHALFEGTESVSLSLDEAQLVVGDRLGRVWVYDVELGVVAQDLRVS